MRFNLKLWCSMILKIEKEIPEYARQELEKIDFNKNGVRRCVVSITEEEAFTYIHPENFDFCDIYGECELVQLCINSDLPTVISKFQFSKNFRSFEQEAIKQQGLVK